MKTAIVLTVKNEARILRNNLLYHKAIGADKAFVYFDKTTDNGEETINDLAFASCANSVSPEEYAHLEYLNKFTSQAVEHHTARQCLNTFDALMQCEKEGIDWLISLDADELICTDFQKPSNLKSFLGNIENNVSVVNFKTIEALQHNKTCGNVFAEETLFKVNPKAYYKTFHNPFTEEQQKFSWWYGQTMGKSAIRVGRDIIPHNVHRYKKIDGSKPIAVNCGNVLHYHAYDAQNFIKKFQNFKEHPDTFLSGNTVESLKLLLRDVVNRAGYSEDDLETYFMDNLMFSEKEVKKFRKNSFLGIFKKPESALMTIEAINEIFEKINKANL